MMLRATFLALSVMAPLSAPLNAQAQQMLDGAGFRAATEGRTFVFGTDGTPYGAEQYLPGDRVNWSFLDGRCLAGKWWEQDRKICFAYEDRPGEALCWEFWRQGDHLMARVADGQSDAVTYSAQTAPEPLYCMGPDAGV